MPNTNCLEGVRCPRCGYEDAFLINALVTVLVTDDGTEDQGGDYEWDGDAYCACADCKFAGRLRDFWEHKEACE